MNEISQFYTQLIKKPEDVTWNQWHRFWDNVTVNKHGYYVWTGRANSKGYGVYALHNYKTKVHRWVFYWEYGYWPDTIDHTCRIKNCVDLRCLEDVTSEENSRRVRDRNTHCRRGHAYDESNLYWYDGRRYCKKCHNITGGKYKEKVRRLKYADA